MATPGHPDASASAGANTERSQPPEHAPGELTQIHARWLRSTRISSAAAESTFRAAIEEITGRQVVSFMSANDFKTDRASEIFVFAPNP